MPCHPPIALLLASLALPGADQPSRKIWERQCTLCHAEDGSGKGPGGRKLPGPSLADPKLQSERTDDALAKAIMEGRAGMPGFRGKLTEAEIRSLVTEVIRGFVPRKGRKG